MQHEREQAQISIDCIVNPFFPRSCSAWEARPSSLQSASLSFPLSLCSFLSLSVSSQLIIAVRGRGRSLALSSARLTLLRLALCAGRGIPCCNMCVPHVRIRNFRTCLPQDEVSLLLPAFAGFSSNSRPATFVALVKRRQSSAKTPSSFPRPNSVCVCVCGSVPHCSMCVCGSVYASLCVCVCLCFSHATRLRVLASSFPE